MKTILENRINTIEINRSKFIAILIKVKDIDTVKDKIQEIKNQYKEATHYCYAYIINDNCKSSDDGEPGGTAGVPIMEVLLKNDLNYVLCVVVRYFGGIKLGAGGLVRAYSKATKMVLDDDNIVSLVPGIEIEFDASYDNQKSIDYLLKNFDFTKEYLDIIKYHVLIPKDKIDILSNINYKVLKEKDIEIK